MADNGRSPKPRWFRSKKEALKMIYTLGSVAILLLPRLTSAVRRGKASTALFVLWVLTIVKGIDRLSSGRLLQNETLQSINLLSRWGKKFGANSSPAPKTIRETTVNQPRLERLKAWSKGYVDGGQVPGISFAVMTPDNLVTHHEGNLGPRGICRLFSMTKPIVSSAILLLKQRGLIDLDAPISTYLQEFRAHHPQVYVSGEYPNFETEAPRREITCRDLLTHRSGFTYGIFGDTPVDQGYKKAFPDDELFNLELSEMVSRLVQLPLLYQPGTFHCYSVSIDVLGYVIEVVSGQKLNVFLQENIFSKLGMVDTDFFCPSSKLCRMSTVLEYTDDFGNKDCSMKDLHERGRGQLPVQLSGGGGLMGTIEDYLKFMRCLLNLPGESGEVQDIFTPETLHELLGSNQLARSEGNEEAEEGARIHINQWAFPTPDLHYEGMGWNLLGSIIDDPQKALGAKNVNRGSTGWSGLAGTFFEIDPSTGVGIIALTQVMPGHKVPLRQQFRALAFNAAKDL